MTNASLGSETMIVAYCDEAEERAYRGEESKPQGTRTEPRAFRIIARIRQVMQFTSRTESLVSARIGSVVFEQPQLERNGGIVYYYRTAP